MKPIRIWIAIIDVKKFPRHLDDVKFLFLDSDVIAGDPFMYVTSTVPGARVAIHQPHIEMLYQRMTHQYAPRTVV